MRLTASIAILMTTLLTAPSFAQNAITPKETELIERNFNEGEIISVLLGDVEQHYVDELGICDALTADQISFTSRDELETIEASLKKIGALPPIMGLYREHYAISGCADASRLNLTVYTVPGASVAYIGFDGNTMTYAGIQNDFMVQVAQVSRVAKPDCKSTDDLAVLTTRVTGKIPLDEFSGEPGYTYVDAWTETWTVRACSEVIKLPVRLGRSPDGSLGISITAPIE